MTTWTKGTGIAAAALLASLALNACSKKPAAENNTATANATAPAEKEFQIGWTIYAGWMPWPYADQAGIVKKWADKYGVKIKIVQINDYAESLNQFTAGKLDAVTSTNMDALTVPAAGFLLHAFSAKLARRAAAAIPVPLIQVVIEEPRPS